MILYEDHHRQARELAALKGDRALAYADERIGYLESVGDPGGARFWRAVRLCLITEQAAAETGGEIPAPRMPQPRA